MPLQDLLGGGMAQQAGSSLAESKELRDLNIQRISEGLPPISPEQFAMIKQQQMMQQQQPQQPPQGLPPGTQGTAPQAPPQGPEGGLPGYLMQLRNLLQR